MSLHQTLATSEVLTLARGYKEFSRFVQGSYSIPEATEGNGDKLFHSSSSTPSNTSSASPPLKVLFVQRKSNRIILNMKAMTDLAESLGFEWSVELNYLCFLTFIFCYFSRFLCDELGEVQFDKQMRLFREADILVSAAGTAVHNMLYMRPLTAVVIIMQPGWCGGFELQILFILGLH